MTIYKYVLIARFTLEDACKNRSQLDVRRAANDELIVSLGNQSLSNLGGPPPPAFCQPNDIDTVDLVVDWLGKTRHKIVATELGPRAQSEL